MTSTFEVQQRNIQAEIAQRDQQIADLQKAQQKIEETVIQIQSSNETTAKILEQLREKNTPTLQTQELATLLQFVIDVKKAGSLHATYQQTSLLNQEASQIEEEASRLASQAKALKDLVSLLRLQQNK